MVNYEYGFELYNNKYTNPHIQAKVSYDDYKNKLLEILKIRYANYHFKYYSNVETFLNEIKDDEIIYSNHLLYVRTRDANMDSIMSSYKEALTSLVNERSINFKSDILNDGEIYSLILKNTLIDDNLLRNLIFQDPIKYHNDLERRNCLRNERVESIVNILTELRRCNIRKIENKTIQQLDIRKLIRIHNQLYKDKINPNYDYRVIYNYRVSIDVRATTFNGTNEPLQKIMKRFYIMLTRPNNEVLLFLEKLKELELRKE